MLEAGRQWRESGTEGIKAEEFKRSTLGLMFMWWFIIVRFLPPPENKARLCVGFVLASRRRIYSCSFSAPVCSLKVTVVALVEKISIKVKNLAEFTNDRKSAFILCLLKSPK